MCVLLSLLFTFVVFQGAAVTLEVQKGQAKGTCRLHCKEDWKVLRPASNTSPWIVQNDGTAPHICPESQADSSTTTHPTPTNETSPSPTTTANNSTHENETRRREDSTPPAKPSPAIWDSVNTTALYRVGSDGIYWVRVNVSGDPKKLILTSISITLKNPYGYLDAADYPAMVFYAVMLVVYLFLAVVWGILLCCYYKDLIRLHFFIAVAILLGVLEKTFFVAEYAVVNTEGVSSRGIFPEYLVVAEAVSALKKTFARILLIVVSSGYGTVIPRLGPLLKWLMLFGVVFFVAASTDGVVRATYYITRDGLPPSVLGAFIPQLVLDVIFIYWIINAIVNTRRTLRLRRNIKKLAFYNHLLYTFAFAVIGIAAFCIWFYISGMIARCEDLQSLWLKECFWHIIFTVLLIVVMILWRPSSNAVRYAYALVHYEEEEEIEQKANKNLETISKQQKATEEVVPPRPSHDMEEDLKWVEENLPTSTIDKVLQPLVDSDEDVHSVV